MNTANIDQVKQWVDDAVSTTAVYDLHTHLYPPSFGDRFCLRGIDELLTYHYLIAETLRATTVPYESYWAMSQAQQAELIWKTLFVERAPISEACRGVITVLHKFGLDIGREMRDLDRYRDFFRGLSAEEHVDRAFKIANVHSVVMTNDVLEPNEREQWLAGKEVDPRFKGVLRIDPLLIGWPGVSKTLSGYGYNVSDDPGAASMKEIRRFLNEWIDKLGALYVAVSLSAPWAYPDDSPTTRVIDEAIIPVARERNIPFALMIGVTRAVNPQLRLAGDSVAKSDIASLERLLAKYPGNKFMCTMLSRENQHELAVTARKFRNLFLFGCWWFLNNPSLIEEMTRMRMELLGTSFTPQHSDARVLDQIIYKWDHSRRVIAKVMTDKFTDLATAGWPVTKEEIAQTAKMYLDTNFPNFLERG